MTLDAERPSAHAARVLLAVLTFLTTGCGVAAFYLALAPGGLGWLEVVLLALFAMLFVWVAMSFWMATAGFLRLLRAKPTLAHRSSHTSAAPVGRTALLMPIYNEDPHRVFAGLRAVYESLQATGHGANFDFFVLSDTTDPDLWLAEELTWARLNQSLGGASQIFYRHRPRNVCRKAGNIADFCERWGSGYQYMIILDADSVMSGDCVCEMTRRMDADSELGILQAPPMPVNRVSLFARCQQFSARVYGPVFMEGFSWWSHIDGNYWGHNAIIRVDAFIRHCGLSKLPGAAPLGGEVLSHDFVEAALMRRAGYKVLLGQDLDGSYEECPPTLIAYAQRDQRWCQGNMQHIRLVFSTGMRAVSRLHFGMGAMSYLASPLWMVFLILSFISVVMYPHTAAAPSDKVSPAVWSGVVFGTTMAMLLLPKFWSYLLVVRNKQQRKLCGGAFRAGISVMIETLVAILVSPIMMMFHTTFVVSTFLGRKVQWNAQQRGEGAQQLFGAISGHWKQTIVGLATLALAWRFAPDMLVWLAPVFVGLILSVPLSMILSSVSLGQALRKRGLLLTPEEVAVPKVLQRHRFLLELPPAKELADPKTMFRRILADPAFVALHRSILAATEAEIEASPEQIRQTEKQLLVGGPHRVSVENRKAILNDPAALSSLHLFAWTSRRKGENEPVEAPV